MSDCSDGSGNCTVAQDPVDGLPVQCVGQWANDKHTYFRNYLAATRGVRAKFVVDGGAAVIDLFAGNGRARIRETGQHIDGTPMIALSEQNITDIVLCDLSPVNADALRRRTAHTRKVRVVEGDCNERIVQIVGMIPQRGFSVALLDPFGHSALDFNTIRRLAAFPRMDLIIHFPIGAMKRSFGHYEMIERFLGLPRAEWGFDIVRAADLRELMPVMRRQLISLGYKDHQISIHAPRVRNASNVTLYHLMFASKNVLGDEIWNSVTRNEPSGQLVMFRE